VVETSVRNALDAVCREIPNTPLSCTLRPVSLRCAPLEATRPVRPFLISTPFRAARLAPVTVTASPPPPSITAVPTPFSVSPFLRMTIGPAHTPVKRIVVFAPAFLTASARDLRLQSSTSLSAETGAPARTQHERNNTVGRRIFNLHHLRVNETQTWEQTEADGLDARWCTSEPTDASMRFRERDTTRRRAPRRSDAGVRPTDGHGRAC